MISAGKAETGARLYALCGLLEMSHEFRNLKSTCTVAEHQMTDMAGSCTAFWDENLGIFSEKLVRVIYE